MAATVPFSSARAVSVPDAPSLGGTIQIYDDNDFALFAGDANNVSRLVLQNDYVWMDQVSQATTYKISLEANETYLYLVAMGGGGGEDVGGRLNGTDITQIPSGPNGIQRATGRTGGSVQNGYLLVNQWLTNWDTAVASGDSNINVAYGKYSVNLADVQTALTGATWGDPPSWKGGGVGSMLTGKAFDTPSSKAVVFRFKGTALGSGLATAGDSSANVSWTAPGSDGGSPILDYTVTAYLASDNSSTGRTCTTPDGSTTNCTVTGLTNGVTYYFKVTARNSAGSSVPSDKTGNVTPADYTPPTLTLAATSASAVANNVTFAVTGNEGIDCTTLSAVNGTDLTVTGGTLASVSQTAGNKCTVSVTTSVAQGSSGTVTVTKAAGFSMTDTSGNAQTALGGSPAATSIAVPATTTTTSTTTTTTLAPSPTAAPAAATDPALSLLAPSTSAVLTTVAPVTTTARSTTARTAVTTTTVPLPTTVPAAPANDAVTAVTIPAGEDAPAAPVTDPGNVRATVGGTDAQISVSRVNGSIVVSSEEFAFAATAKDSKNSTVPLDSSGSLSVDKASNINVRTIGLAPASDVDAWMMSTPTPLGRVRTDADGVVKGSFPVPTKIEAGAHRIVLTGVTQSGKQVVLSIGVRVADTAQTAVKWSWVFAGLIAVAMLFALILPARRRHDDDDEAAAPLR